MKSNKIVSGVYIKQKENVQSDLKMNVSISIEEWHIKNS